MAELEYDRQLGNLSDEEHRRMWTDYEAQGVAVLKALDERAQGIDALIEWEVEARREARAGAPAERDRTGTAGGGGEPGQG